MTTFTLTIQCDNAAFEDSMATEIMMILSAVRSAVKHGLITDNGVGGEPVHDTNGNRVGEWRITDGEPVA